MKPSGVFALALCLSAGAQAAGEDAAKLIEEFTGRSEARKRSPQVLSADCAKVVDALLGDLGAAELSKRAAARGKLERICHHLGRPGAEEHRLAICKAMAARLGPTTPRLARVWLLRMLQHVGRAEAAAAVAGLLAETDAQVRECARRALQANTSPEAGAALRAELGRPGKAPWKAAVVSALGYRRDAAAVGAIGKLLGQPDASLASAAAAALGKIGGLDAAKALAAALGKAPAEVRPAVVDACLLCGDHFLSAGRKREAAAIYEKLYVPAEAARVRIAALRGLVSAEPDKAVPRVMELFVSKDPQARASAGVFVREVPGAAATKAFAAQLAKLAPSGQVLLLAALAARGDPAAGPAVIRAGGGKDEKVRAAALSALGTLGDASAVEPLARAAAAGSRPEQAAARRSLARLKGSEVDRAILARMPKAEPKVRVELIAALGARRTTAAAPALLAAAKDADGAVRSAALAALGKLAGEKELPALLGLLTKAPDDAERRTAQKAVAAACGRVQDKEKCASAVLAALASAPPAGKCALLSILPNMPTSKALAAVLRATKDKDKAVCDAAVRALTDWPDAAATGDLLAFARGSKSQIHKVLALRAYVRLLGTGGGTGEALVRQYAAAMNLADRREEKKLVLAGLAGVPHVAALRLVEPYLAEKSLQAEAQAAVVSIGRTIGGQHEQLVVPLLEKVRETAGNPRLRKAAGDALSQIQRYKDYILTWRLCGPYAVKGKSGPDLLEIAFAPERPDAGEVKWRPATAGAKGGEPWMVDLGRLVGGEHRAVYLRATITSPQATAATLEIGSDDGIKVWLNGRVVHTHNVSRAVRPGDDKVKVNLAQGANLLMIKVFNGAGPWAVCARVVGPQGGPIRGLRTSAE